MAKKKEPTYSEAMARLQDIVNRIDSGEIEVDQLADTIREANRIIAFCSDKLTKADEEIKKISTEQVADD